VGKFISVKIAAIKAHNVVTFKAGKKLKEGM